MMTRQVPCAIKGCPKMAKAPVSDIVLGDHFTVCDDCERSIVLDSVLRMQQDIEQAPRDWAYNFAAMYNGWKRERHGASLSHKSGVILSIKPLGPVIIRGNG
jgi:hypothetical protein